MQEFFFFFVKRKGWGHWEWLELRNSEKQQHCASCYCVLQVLMQTNPISPPSFMILLIKSVGFPESLHIAWLSRVKWNKKAKKCWHDVEWPKCCSLDTPKQLDCKMEYSLEVRSSQRIEHTTEMFITFSALSVTSVSWHSLRIPYHRMTWMWLWR